MLCKPPRTQVLVAGVALCSKELGQRSCWNSLRFCCRQCSAQVLDCSCYARVLWLERTIMAAFEAAVFFFPVRGIFYSLAVIKQTCCAKFV